MKLVRALSVLLGFSLPGMATEPTGDVRMVTIAAVGDTMVGSVYPTRAALPPAAGRRVFERVRELWAGADVVTGNLEGTISSDPAAARALGKNSYRFLMPPESLAIYREAGFNVLCVANNHAMDAGPSARAATLAALDEAGLAHGGSLVRPATVVTTASGVRVGFVAAAPHVGCFPLDSEAVAEKVRELKEKEGCQLVLVSMHAGAEGEKALHVPGTVELFLGANRGNVTAFARAVVDAGADLVIGSGPHVPRGMEVYKGRLIAYSLGNFATWGTFNVLGPSGLGFVLQVVLCEDGTLVGLRIRSTRQDKGSAAWAAGIAAEPDPNDGARKLVERLSREDFQTEIARYYLPDGDGPWPPSPNPTPDPSP
ncbi:MAG: CapA family protein [Holophagales bacterium]|jgi:poly-gamma-glutamate capsule biosynthesis protein CapA/YwtB (metallophosphatase superfamily)|nr:CapA family protein [Holophagales bacterium]MBK9966786.1 CapA family protein [Holophagales bacterium]